jgi:hypothetical protein
MRNRVLSDLIDEPMPNHANPTHRKWLKFR